MQNVLLNQSHLHKEKGERKASVQASHCSGLVNPRTTHGIGVIAESLSWRNCP